MTWRTSLSHTISHFKDDCKPTSSQLFFDSCPHAHEQHPYWTIVKQQGRNDSTFKSYEHKSLDVLKSILEEQNRLHSRL